MSNSSQSAIPSYSIEAEQAILGGLLLDNNKWDEISLILDEKNFFSFTHKKIFSVMKEMFEKNQEVDLLILERVLEEKSLLTDLGGLAYLAEISRNTPSVANIVTYAEIVKRDSQARSLFSLGNDLRCEAIKVNSQETLDALVEQTEKRLTELTFNHTEQDTTANIGDTLDAVLKQMALSSENNSCVTGTSFGIDKLDEHTAGGQNGDLIILAARPSMGKTALSLKFIESALNTVTDKPAQYFSLEMPAQQLMQRFLAMRAKVPSQKIRQANNLYDEEWARIGEAIAYINKEWSDRLLIDDSGYLTPQMLRTRVRRNARKYGMPSMIVIDYIQLMSAPGFQDGKNRNLEISAISRSLKELAKEMNCPVIALSQLNRNLEQRADKRPMSSDLRDSGALEQDADIILFIYRDEVYHFDTNFKGIGEIIIGKQRNGPIGTILTRFRGEFSEFENIPDDEYETLRRDI
ncbi:replicative DNA helicase [Pasteurella skyensis]|uniref:replicative DNA helicase n=1 Tax=Phocoenobacter skyensis TaxID=97481 RepID=UPI0027568329|nr:replicative DNA helicase [Pasteurella skyensis]MDP8189099.1 replicative DNA helicase [Pasteurella skyensis]